MPKLGCLVLSLACAAAREIAPSPAPLMKLRGGGKNEIIMGVSAATALANGALVALGQSDKANAMGFGLFEVIDDPRYGIAMLGWGMGKVSALMAGGEYVHANSNQTSTTRSKDRTHPDTCTSHDVPTKSTSCMAVPSPRF